jgi:CheY-like chemotaxis protein
MGIFRKSRRQRGEEESPLTVGETEGAQLGAAGQKLRARLREIATAAAAPEEAFEPVLRAILEATFAQAGAVCVYDARHRGLRLVAEVGLSDEGCRRLRHVRRADPTSWDMPLLGLLNRRAYLIESAARNRYVPHLVEPVGALRTVACIPLYVGLAPVGSLILATLAPRALGERDIHALERPVSELARLIELARRHATGAASEAPGFLPPLVAERDRLHEETRVRAAEQARLTAELEALGAETERLRTALEASAEEQARLESEIVQGRAASDEDAAAMTSALEATRAAARAESERFEARIAELAAENDRLQNRLTATEAVAAQMRERERDYERLAGEQRAAAAREHRLRDELEAVTRSVEDGGREELRAALEAVQTAEAAAAAAASEAEAANAALAAAQSVAEALETEASQARAETERAEGETRAAQAEQRRVELELAEARGRDLAATARLAELARETETLREERARQTADSREQQAETVTLVARLEAITAERDRLRESLAAISAERAEAPADAPAKDAAAAPPAPAPREPVRLVTVAAPGRGRAKSTEAGRRLISILDVDAAWERVAIDGHHITILPPSDDAAATLAESTPARIIANLAAPGALGTLAALRASGSTARVWGCLADPSRARVLPLGMVEPGDCPLDAEGILAVLATYAVRGTRVVTAGADVDALMSLRQALSRQGMSVSMVWDAKQALDVFRVVRPEVVVIDLNLPKQDGYRIAAHCAEIDPIPNAVFIPGGDDAAAAFAAACAGCAKDVRGITPERMVRDVIAGNEAPAVERRQKLRAIGK